MVGKQITFYATSDVYDIIKESSIGEKKQSKWINDKILEAVLIKKQPKQIVKGEVVLID